MKSNQIPAALDLKILILAALFASVVCIGAAGKKVPLLTNIKVDIILLIVIGMTICSQGGIGRVTAAGQWTRPLSILGYVLGGLILLVAAAGLLGWKLPLVETGQKALLAMAVLVTIKFANSFLHYYLFTPTK